jgi:hypothetical protein
MGYIGAMTAAGATVHESKSFGDYQGTTIARVTFEGTTGFVVFSFGSCSYCDAWQAEFGYGDEPYCDEHWTDEQALGCEDCATDKAKYTPRFIAFGQSYLKRLATAAEVLAEYPVDPEWDDPKDRAIRQWVQARA